MRRSVLCTEAGIVGLIWIYVISPLNYLGYTCVLTWRDVNLRLCSVLFSVDGQSRDVIAARRYRAAGRSTRKLCRTDRFIAFDELHWQSAFIRSALLAVRLRSVRLDMPQRMLKRMYTLCEVPFITIFWHFTTYMHNFYFLWYVKISKRTEMGRKCSTYGGE